MNKIFKLIISKVEEDRKIAKAIYGNDSELVSDIKELVMYIGPRSDSNIDPEFQFLDSKSYEDGIDKGLELYKNLIYFLPEDVLRDARQNMFNGEPKEAYNNNHKKALKALHKLKNE